jgi:hypothetical protein
MFKTLNIIKNTKVKNIGNTIKELDQEFIIFNNSNSIVDQSNLNTPKNITPLKPNELQIQNTIDLIVKVNPNCKIIFTISPVRHLKDGYVENQLSKSNLIVALHSASEIQNFTKEYFPSYEIMMDELRDYRFYSEDMLHPNQVAIDYIWEKFVESSVSNDALSIMTEVEAIQRDFAHRPFTTSSVSYQKFQLQLESKISKVKLKFPHINF